MKEEKEYCWDEEGNKHEVGPSFKGGFGGVSIVSPIRMCAACKNHKFVDESDKFICLKYGEVPKKYEDAKAYDCPEFDNRNNGWYQLIKDKIEGAKNG